MLLHAYMWLHLMLTTSLQLWVLADFLSWLSNIRKLTMKTRRLLSNLLTSSPMLHKVKPILTLLVVLLGTYCRVFNYIFTATFLHDNFILSAVTGDSLATPTPYSFSLHCSNTCRTRVTSVLVTF